MVTAVGVLSLILLGMELGAVYFATCAGLFVLTRSFGLRVWLIAALVASLTLGFLRAEHLRETPAALDLIAPGGLVEPANVIMSADRGLLVVAGAERTVRFVPWEQIAAVRPRTSAGPRDWIVPPLARLRRRIGAIVGGVTP